MTDILDQDSTLRDQDEKGYDLGLLANMSKEDLENLSVEELERILGLVQTSIQKVTQEWEILDQEIKSVLAHEKTKNIKKDYEREVRSILTEKGDVARIADFLRDNNINEHTDIKTVIALINRNPIVKSVVMNYMEDSLSPEEIEKFWIWLKGKSPNQIQKMFQKKNFQELGSFFGKHSQKILMSAWSALVLVGIVLRLSANNPFKSWPSRKERANKEVVDTSKSLIQVPDKIIPPLEKIDSVQQLQARIPDSALAPWITAERVMSSINAIADQETRIKTIAYLQSGDIASVQEIFGMKRETQYKSNRASWVIDDIVLERFEDPLFNLSGDSLLVCKDMPQDVKEVYKKFVSGEYENDLLNYIIVCKKNCTLYLFAKDHKLLNHQTVLLWSKVGDETFALHKSPTTPAWFYRIQQNTREDDGSGIVYVPGYMKNGQYFSEDAQGYLLDLLPIDIVTGKYNHAYDITKGTISIHPTPSHLEKKRKQDIESSDLTKKRETGWCIDASRRSVVYDNISAWWVEEGSIVLITQDHE